VAKLSKLRLIQLRRRAVEDDIARQQEVLSALKSKLSDLEIAERVLTSLGGEDAEEAVAEENQNRSALVASIVAAMPRPAEKPSGIPTMPVMILEALRDARTKGRLGLEPREMAQYIAGKYWPGMPLHIVGPTAWRMHKDGRLGKRESKYFIVQSDEGSDAETSEPSTTKSGAGGGPRGAATHPSPAGSTPVGSTRLRRELFASTAIPMPVPPV
jgi:hypothetical protein